MDWIGVGALVAALAAAWYARRSWKVGHVQAHEAKRANDLEEAAQQRAVEAAERSRESNRIRWTLERISPSQGGSGQFALRNVGTDAARDVRAWTVARTITTGPFETDAPSFSPPGQVRRLYQAVVPSNASMTFVATSTSPLATVGNDLAVTWEGRDEPEYVPFPA